MSNPDYDNPLNKVKGSERLVKSSEQTEPTISKMEQVETMSCQECKRWDVYKGCRERVCKYEPKDEPQTCETCRFELYCPEMCEGCCEWDSHYEPKDEPTISKMEQVDKDINVRSKNTDMRKGADDE